MGCCGGNSRARDNTPSGMRKPGDVLVRPNFNSNRRYIGPSGRDYGKIGHHNPFWISLEDFDLHQNLFERDFDLENSIEPLPVALSANGKPQTLITIIIPVAPHHHESVERAEASVRAQTVPCNVITIYDDAGRGPGWARNQGLAKAETPFVTFLDADDHLLPRYAEHVLHAFDGIHYVYSDWYTGDVRKTAPDCAFAKPGAWHAVTALVPTSWALDVGGFSESMPGGEDVEFYMRLIAAGYCGQRVSEPLFVYTGGGERSRSFRKRDDYGEIMASMASTYSGAAMACCAQPKPGTRTDRIGNSKRNNDVLVITRWQGKQTVRGAVSNRVYPRVLGGQRLYVDPRDAQAQPTVFRRVEQALIEQIAATFTPPARYDPRRAEKAPRAQVKPDFNRLIEATEYLFADQATEPERDYEATIEFPSSQNAGGYLIDKHTLNIAAPHIPKTGYCVEAGVGNVGFYCIEFARLGHKTIALDPIISDELEVAIDESGLKNKITAIEAAFAEVGGHTEFWPNKQDPNVSSLRMDHWGAGGNPVTVPCMTYLDIRKMMSKTEAPPACLKLDIEGYEPTVLPIIAKVPPKVLIFEYGGGDLKKRRVGGWSKANMAAASEAFEALREAGYRSGAVIDANLQRVFEFEMDDVPVGGYEGLFSEESGFGNIVLWGLSKKK